MNETQRDRLLTRYLLGNLPEDEADRLELELLGDSDLFETAEVVEGELIDAYVRDELDPEERQLFEQNLMRSERVAHRFAAGRALAGVAHTEPAVAPSPTRPIVSAEPRPSLWERLFPAPARLAWAATLVTAVAAGLFAVQNFELQEELARFDRAATAQSPEPSVSPTTEPSAVDPTRRAELEGTLSEMQERNRTLQSELDQAQERLAALSEPAAVEPGADRRVRGSRGGDERGPRGSDPVVTRYLGQANRSAGPGGNLPRLEIDQDRGTVELQLELGEEPDHDLIARVTRDGSHVYQGRDVVIDGEGRATTALLSLPAGVFTSGLHRIELTGPEGDAPRYYEVDVVMSP
jgi:anti-sigma factor RsiW